MNEAPLKIRPLQAGDREVWEDLWSQYNAFYGREGETALPGEIVRASWQRLLDPDEPVFGLVAELNGELVGLVHYLFHRNMIQIENTCYLQDLFTVEAARGHGVATGLVEAVAVACESAGVRNVYWHTHESNKTARRVYDRVAADTGFLVYRRETDQGS